MSYAYFFLEKENQKKKTIMHWVEPRTITYLLTNGAEPFLRSCQLCSDSKTSQSFMEPEG
jgi:hypothetical protein